MLTVVAVRCSRLSFHSRQYSFPISAAAMNVIVVTIVLHNGSVHAPVARSLWPQNVVVDS